MYNDWTDYLMFGFLGLVGILFLVLVGGLVFAGTDEVYKYAARDGIFACEARNLEPVRKAFSAEVACRARNLGADTLTVRTAQ